MYSRQLLMRMQESALKEMLVYTNPVQKRTQSLMLNSRNAIANRQYKLPALTFEQRKTSNTAVALAIMEKGKPSSLSPVHHNLRVFVAEEFKDASVEAIEAFFEHVFGVFRVPHDREGLAEKILWADAVQGAHIL